MAWKSNVLGMEKASKAFGVDVLGIGKVKNNDMRKALLTRAAVAKGCALRFFQGCCLTG